MEAGLPWLFLFEEFNKKCRAPASSLNAVGACPYCMYEKDIFLRNSLARAHCC